MFKAFFESYKLEVIAGLIIALSLFIGVHILNDSRVENERDKAVSDLKIYKMEQKALADKQALENKIKLDDARAKTILAEQKGKQAVAKVLDGSNKTIESLNKKIRGHYENKSIESNLDNGAGVLLPSSGGTNAITEVAENIKGFTSSESISDTRIVRLEDETKTLEDACSVTTIYYNELRTWADAACEQIGCE